MDYGTFHGFYTLGLMFAMIGVFAWAYSKKRKPSFDEAANLVFADEDKAKGSIKE